MEQEVANDQNFNDSEIIGKADHDNLEIQEARISPRLKEPASH